MTTKDKFDCRVLQHQVGKDRPSPFSHEWAKVCFIDPPYNIGVDYAEDPTGDKLSGEDYFGWCRNVMREMLETLHIDGTLWWLCPPSHADRIGPMLTDLVGPRRYLIVKRESFAQYQQKSLTEDYRLLYVHSLRGSKVELTENLDSIRVPSKRQEMGDKRADPRGRVPGQVWDIRRLQGTAKHRVEWHPAQLPPELLSRIVLGWSNPGDLVIDFCGGSGTMGEACKSHGRRCILLDQSETYVAKMKERLGV